MHAPEPPAVEDAPEKGLWSIIDRQNTFGCLQYAASALVIVFLLLLVLRRETIGFSPFVCVTFAVLVAGCHCLGVPLSPKKAQAQRARNGALQAPKRAQEVAELAERERLRVEDERRADDERIAKAKARAKAAEAERRRRAAAAVPQAFTPSGFEHEVAALLRRDGWKIIRDGGGPNDGGIDVLASRDGHKLGVQCKFYGPRTPLTSGEIQKYLGTPRLVHRVNEMLIVTTGPVTAPARKMVAASDFPTEVVSGAELAPWRAGRARYVPRRGLVK